MKADKKQYYKLDEIGVVGTQEKKSAAQRRRDHSRTAEIIKQEKAGRVVVSPTRESVS